MLKFKKGVKNHSSKKSYEKELTYFVKDNFWTQNFFTTASSNFLTDFQPDCDATVIKLLKKRGYVCSSKVDLDEFACGGSGLLSKNGVITNPHNPQHITGGSSSGPAFTVAKRLVKFAVGSDTGGSIRCPAAYCGVIGFKPSYGLISRYGLIPLASSLDTVGILASNVAITKQIFSIITKKDSLDLLTVSDRKNKSEARKSTRKIAIISGLEKYLEDNLKELYYKTLEILKKNDYLIETVQLPKKIRDNLQITYLILSCSELLSHLNSLQGITYGQKENITVAEKRNNYLGKEIKKRLLMGAYFLQNEILEQAQKMRFLVDEWVKKVFANHNFLIFPSMNSPAPKINEVSSSFAGSQIIHWSDNLLLLANFTGIPSLSLPMGFVNGLPVSININSSYGKDNEVLEIAEKLEEIIKVHHKK